MKRPRGQFWWQTNDSAVSEYMYGYQSRWISPENFRDPVRLAETFFDATVWVLMQASDTSIFPSVPGHESCRARAEDLAARVSAGMNVIREAPPGAGNYANEADYHEPDWQEPFWGSHYPRLLAIKQRYDPTGMFSTHHSVGSELRNEG